MNSMLFRAAAFVMLWAAIPTGGAAAGQQNMEMVWSQSDGLRQEIYSSSRKNDVWSEPVKITDSNANKLHPVLEIAPDGSKWAFWSAVNLDGIAIEYAVNKDGKWSEPVKMELHQSSAITPSVLIEESGAIWVVWAGNDGGQDEIYYSRSLKNAVWEEPKTVHQANETPDIKPEIKRNSQGQIEVRWLGFREGRYRLLASTYAAAEGWSAEQEIKQEEEKKEETVLKEEIKAQLPAFMPKDSQYSLKVLAR